MIKAIIFDQDGTLYPKNSKLYKASSELTQWWIKDSFKIDEVEFEQFYDNLKKRFPNPFHGFQAIGLSIEDYHNNVFNKLDANEFLKKDCELVQMFKRLKINKYIVTLSSRKFSNTVLNALGISDSFDEIHYVNEYKYLNDKIEIYDDIRTKKFLREDEVCIVGDNYDVDLKLAKEKGYKCILVSKDNKYDVDSISKIIELENILENLI